MNVKELRGQLQAALNALSAFEAEVFQPQGKMTLREAMVKLSILESFSIDMEVWRGSGRDCISVGWKVWDGTKYFGAKTLVDAVNSCLAAHRPMAADALEQCEAVLS